MEGQVGIIRGSFLRVKYIVFVESIYGIDVVQVPMTCHCRDRCRMSERSPDDVTQRNRILRCPCETYSTNSTVSFSVSAAKSIIVCHTLKSKWHCSSPAQLPDLGKL